jgi:hypothetical protein
MVCLPIYPQPYGARKQISICTTQKINNNKNFKQMGKIFNINDFSKEALREAAKEIISDKKFEGATKASFLPEKGTFESVEIVVNKTEKENYSYIRVNTADGNAISLSTLGALAHKGSKEDARLMKIDRKDSVMNGKFILRGQPINPALTGNQADVAALIIGKNFEATPVDVLVLPYKEEGYSTEKSAKEALITKTMYQVTLK